jgi:hypothetical protein
MILNMTVGKPKLYPKRALYEARLEDGSLLGRYRCPFFGAARALLAMGYPEDTTLVMRHEGSEVISLRGPIGKMAKLTVLENETFGPVLRTFTRMQL